MNYKHALDDILTEEQIKKLGELFTEMSRNWEDIESYEQELESNTTGKRKTPETVMDVAHQIAWYYSQIKWEIDKMIKEDDIKHLSIIRDRMSDIVDFTAT